jgi:hypothetical protein
MQVMIAQHGLHGPTQRTKKAQRPEGIGAPIHEITH